MNVTIDHPRQRLLCYFSGDYREDNVAMMRRLVERLAASREWMIGPPMFIDQTDYDAGNPGDEPVRTVGGVLELYSALPPWGDKLPHEVDEAQFEEVSFLVEELCKLSKSTRQEIGINLDNTQIGWIEVGKPDEGIVETFLAEWKKYLEQSDSGGD